MNRISKAFARGRAENRALFIAYICAGDPNPEVSVEVCRTLLANGVELLELGVPFSDPLADGLTNQLAAQRALDAGTTQGDVLAMVATLRAEGIEAPIIFYTYYNLVYNIGVDTYAKRAKEAGVDGLLVLDLPPEEASEVMEACTKYGLQTVFIIAPTTPDERIPTIAAATTGFIYYVSQEGVTGERRELAANLGHAMERIRAHTDLPVGIGFGISNPEQAREVAALADGVIVGSALVNCIGRNPNDPAAALKEIGEKAASLSAPLREPAEAR